MTSDNENTGRPERRRSEQLVLEVRRSEWISPHMVRLFLGGDRIEPFAQNPYTDKYVKMFFTPPGSDLQPPWDMAELRATLPPEELPVTRTYSIRHVDEAAGEVAIDFVVHGDEGLAAPWAASAKAGDIAIVSSPGGGYSPADDADWFFFAGDESALPAIAAALEALPAEAVGDAFIEVAGRDDELALQAPDGVEIHWVHRGDGEAGTTAVLADAIDNAPWREGRVDAFIHGERESVKALRDIVMYRHELGRDQVSISGYWAHGRVEDRFQAEKREPIGEILPRT